MATFTLQELVDRAKVYVDDDHNATKSWIKDPKWLAIANAEYAQLHKRWVRNGLLSPQITRHYLSGSVTQFSGVLAVVGVARDEGGSVTMLNQAQAVVGRDAFWRGSREPAGPSVRWSAYGEGDVVNVELDPVPTDLTYQPFVAEVPPVKATLDIGAVLTGLGITAETVLTMKTAGPTDIQIEAAAYFGTGTPGWVQLSPTVYLYEYYLSSPRTTSVFEASIAADPTLPFEVLTASTTDNTWTTPFTLQSFTGGADTAAAIPESGNYLIRYVPTPTAATALSQSVELPFGADERLVLGIARRAHLKDSGASALLERLIMEADAELGFSSMGKVNGPRVMNRRHNPHSTPTPGSWPERQSWRFF